MLHAVIMAGGSGTRFWPASRESRPKQFLCLGGDTPLLRQTFERLTPLVPAQCIWVVTTRSSAEMTRELLPELPLGNVLAEPVGRDTAACVGYAAQVLRHHDPEAVCVVLPADHVIGEEETFRATLAAGAAHVQAAGGLLTFGVRPTSPETGYGYLHIGPQATVVDGHAVHRLETFVEKPELATARAYVEGGDHLWNAGIFAWAADDLLMEIERQLPRLAAGLGEIAASFGSERERSITNEVYPRLPRISVDFGIMEGAETCWTLPVEYPWSDVGSWSALPALLTRDSLGNATRGRTLTLDGHNNVVISEGPVVAVADVDGLVVVATSDAVLVVPADHAQRVKEVVAAIGAAGWDDVL